MWKLHTIIYPNLFPQHSITYRCQTTPPFLLFLSYNLIGSPNKTGLSNHLPPPPSPQPPHHSIHIPLSPITTPLPQPPSPQIYSTCLLTYLEYNQTNQPTNQPTNPSIHSSSHTLQLKDRWINIIRYVGLE